MAQYKVNILLYTINQFPTADRRWHFSLRDVPCRQSSHLLTPSPNVSTTPLRQWGFRKCLPFSWTTLRGKHCQHPIAVMGVVDTFGHILFIFSIRFCGIFGQFLSVHNAYLVQGPDCLHLNNTIIDYGIMNC